VFRAADANEVEEDGIALGLGVAEHAHLGTDRIGELRERDARLTVSTCAKDSGAAKSTTGSGDRLIVAS
jgi:hypothetical protein